LTSATNCSINCDKALLRKRGRKLPARLRGRHPVPWTLRTIRASIPALHDYSLSGVWRVLQHYKLGLRTAHVRRFSPDPEYRRKEDTLL
jgi:hypothetical protein